MSWQGITVAALALAGATPEPVEGSAGDVYRKAMDSALDRAQRRLENSVDLYQDHSSWENAWRVESAHYRVRTTHSWFLGSDLAQGLEAMLGHFQSVLGTTHAPSEPWAVHVFPTLPEYNQYGTEHGADHSSFYGSFFSGLDPERAVATYYDSNATLLRMWVTHSALHQYMDSAFNREAPTWLEEGLASYFALYWDAGYGVSELTRIKRLGRFVPLRQLLRENIGQYTSDPHTRFIELGMLMTYLLHYRTDLRFGEYLQLRMVADDFALHPAHEWLTEDVGRLEAEFSAFEFPAR